MKSSPPATTVAVNEYGDEDGDDNFNDNCNVNIEMVVVVARVRLLWHPLLQESPSVKSSPATRTAIAINARHIRILLKLGCDLMVHGDVNYDKMTRCTTR